MLLRSGYGKCCVITDCAELFIERPKSLSTQAATWSDYKHHKKFKFLVGITITEFISFFSSCYGGRANNKFISRDSGFYDLLERDDEVMADRGFQIQEDLFLHFCRLVLSRGARVKSQSLRLKKIKEVANLRIHVERAINRIKYFMILKGTIPVTMIQHVDDIILTSVGLCNLKRQLKKNQRKGSTEVTSNFHYKLAD